MVAEPSSVPEPGRGARPLMGSARLSGLDWRKIAFVLLFALLVWQVVIPFVMVVWTSLKVSRPGDADFLDFSSTLANNIRAFAIHRFRTPTGNPLLFAAASTWLSFTGATFLPS